MSLQYDLGRATEAVRQDSACWFRLGPITPVAPDPSVPEDQHGLHHAERLRSGCSYNASFPLGRSRSLSERRGAGHREGSYGMIPRLV